MSAFAGLTVAIADSPNPLKRPRIARREHFLVAGIKEFCHGIHVHDGDPAGRAADLLVLYGNSRSFYRYATQMRRRPAGRPKVAVWQVDPLPPMELDRRLEGKALQFASRFAHSRLLRPFEMAGSIPLFRSIARGGLGIYSDRSRRGFVDPAMTRTVVEAYGFIERGLREGWLDHVFVSTVGKQRFLASRGIDSTFAPVGFHQRVGEDRGLPRDVDVLFLGKLKKDDRRRRLEVVLKAIEKSGARVMVVEKGCYGERRTALLNRTKIVLNLLKYPWDTPWMRWATASACGALVVSETLSDPDPLVPGLHYVEAPFDELPATIERLLADPENALATARRCAHLFRTQLSLRRSLETILTSAFKERVPA